MKEENLRGGHSRETQSEVNRERGMKENSEKKESIETDRDRDDHHGTFDSRKEVRKARYYLLCIYSSFVEGFL